jgi:hypothetical protein
MENVNETLDSPNEETDTSETEKIEETESTEDVTALKEKLTEISDKNRQLFERAKRAEGFEKNSEGKWIKIHSAEPPPKSQSNEPDYAKLAFLETKGVAHPDDQKIVIDEAVRLKLPLTDILQMEHIKGKLQTQKDQREAQEGMPKGRGTGGGKTQGDVDYWVDQKNTDGTFKTPEDPELAAKVIDARIKKEKQGSKFSDILYTG